MKPTVSILIPTFNYGDYISETLSNILNQSFQDWECIVLDDGSTDETPDIVRQYCSKDSRIRYKAQANQGLSAARNSALGFASGKFIQLLDSDDLLSPTKLERQVAFMENHPETGISYTDARYFRHDHPEEMFRRFEYINENEYRLTDEQWIPETKWIEQCELIEYLYMQNIAPINSMLIRRNVFDIVGVFDKTFSSLEDWHFFSRAALKGIRFSFVDVQGIYSKVRIHTDSMSFNGERMEWHHIRVLLEMEQGIRVLSLPCKSPKKMIDYRVRKLIKRASLTNFLYIRSLASIMGWRRVIKLYLKELYAARKRQ